MNYRITKIICPSCKGKPESSFLGFCMWCDGEKRVSTDAADRYSRQLWVIAGGGYIDGDHDLSDMRRMEREAEAVRTLAGLPPLDTRSARP